MIKDSKNKIEIVKHPLDIGQKKQGRIESTKGF